METFRDKTPVFGHVGSIIGTFTSPSSIFALIF